MRISDWSSDVCSSDLLFAGRAGSALAAEIGLMRATDQLSAMEMMAVDPMRHVIAPRFIAGVIAAPLLTAIFRPEEHTSELQLMRISYAVFCLTTKKQPLTPLCTNNPNTHDALKIHTQY